MSLPFAITPDARSDIEYATHGMRPFIHIGRGDTFVVEFATT